MQQVAGGEGGHAWSVSVMAITGILQFGTQLLCN